MNFEDIYSDENMDQLQRLADKQGLLLSTELINFADDVWGMAIRSVMQANPLFKQEKTND